MTSVVINMYHDNDQILSCALEEHSLVNIALDEAHGINENPGEFLVPVLPRLLQTIQHVFQAQNLAI